MRFAIVLSHFDTNLLILIKLTLVSRRNQTSPILGCRGLMTTNAFLELAVVAWPTFCSAVPRREEPSRMTKQPKMTSGQMPPRILLKKRLGCESLERKRRN